MALAGILRTILQWPRAGFTPAAPPTAQITFYAQAQNQSFQVQAQPTIFYASRRNP